MAIADLMNLNAFDLEGFLAGAATLPAELGVAGLTITQLAVLAVASGLAAVGVIAALIRRPRRRDRLNDLEERVEESAARLQTLEILLADAIGEAVLLRQRVEQLTSRQESLSTGNARTGLRQAIALSKHGATTRQLIDTCDLSQGEAHLIQTLYGRPAGQPTQEELH